MSAFHERLKQLRLERNIMQKDLAELLNVTTRAMRNYEQGLHEPCYDALIALADYFDVSLDYLVGRSDNPERR